MHFNKDTLSQASIGAKGIRFCVKFKVFFPKSIFLIKGYTGSKENHIELVKPKNERLLRICVSFFYFSCTFRKSKKA